MALPARPDVVDLNGQTTYRSLDAVDQRHFNDLATDLHRRKFVEMIHRLRETNAPSLSNGQAIVNEWRRSGRFLSNLRGPSIAVQAIAPLSVQIAPPPTVQIAPPPTVQAVPSPPQSPLAELSPRFANNYEYDRPLSPTHGQRGFIQAQLNESWKFANVAFQKGKDTVNKSIYKFVRHTADNVIEEQLAVKSLEVLDLEQEQVKREIQFNGLVAATRCSHLLQCRGNGSRHLTHTVNNTQIRQWTAFLYQDFADCEDLEKLINDHQNRSKQINEHYIWYTLHELTEALSALHNGKCPKPCQQQAVMPGSTDFEQLPSEPWVPILHLDIKSDNVMLLKENKDYPSYPKPVLGDFNLSHLNNSEFQDQLTSEEGPRFAGTSGWQPPERSSEGLIYDGGSVRINPAYVPHQWPVNEKADIWGLGKIAHQMIFAHAPDLYEATLSREADWPKLQGNTLGSHLLDWKSMEPRSDYCSEELYNLVKLMLRHNPAHRPDLDALRTAVYCGLRKHDLTHGSEIRTKRKRDNTDHLQIYPSVTSDLPTKFDIGQIYSPIRKRLKIDVDDAAIRAQYTQLIAAWNTSSLNPSTAAQIEIVDALDTYLVQTQDPDLDVAEHWTAKHMVSCLRKRLHQDAGNIYVLKNESIDKGHEDIDNAMSVDSKRQVLEYLDDEFWNHTSQPTRDVFRHTVQWGRWLLENCSVDGQPAEPRGPALVNRSLLHQGMYDWIFVKPSGAFSKV